MLILCPDQKLICYSAVDNKRGVTSIDKFCKRHFEIFERDKSTSHYRYLFMCLWKEKIWTKKQLLLLHERCCF